MNLKPDNTCQKEVEFWQQFYSSGHEFAVMDIQFKCREEWPATLGNGKKFPYRHSVRLGYHSKPCTMTIRNKHLQDIYEINTSIPERQGREMSKSYSEFPVKYVDIEQCKDHYQQFFACFTKENKMVAYSNIHVCGEIASISMILGHWEEQKKTGIMVNLMDEMIAFCIEKEIRYLIYHHADGGTEGLQKFKKMLGFKPVQL